LPPCFINRYIAGVTSEVRRGSASALPEGKKNGHHMEGTNNRQIARDSLFVMADVRLDGVPIDYRIKVRNLSAGGLMGEGDLRVTRGMRLWVNLRNIGWVEGTVAWIQDSRFGVAFVEEIDPKEARAPLTPGEHTPRYVRPPLPVGPEAPRGSLLRKI
jgi:hypothetical protein